MQFWSGGGDSSSLNVAGFLICEWSMVRRFMSAWWEYGRVTTTLPPIAARGDGIGLRQVVNGDRNVADNELSGDDAFDAVPSPAGQAAADVRHANGRHEGGSVPGQGAVTLSDCRTVKDAPTQAGLIAIESEGLWREDGHRRPRVLRENPGALVVGSGYSVISASRRPRASVYGRHHRTPGGDSPTHLPLVASMLELRHRFHRSAWVARRSCPCPAAAYPLVLENGSG